MQLALQDFTALVRTQAAAVSASCRTLLDLSVGSVLRAVLEANASVALWMQWLIMDVLATTRAATSHGADLDSWVADFGLWRLGAVPAAADVRFSRAVTGVAAVVPVGALVRTVPAAGDEAQVFAVSDDASRAEWTGSGYQLAAGASSILLPVRAVMAGRGGNVQAGTLQLMASAVPGVDQVTNQVAASGGMDAETDPALRARFAEFMDSRTRATAQAVKFAVQGVRAGLFVQVVDRVDSAGALRAGHFTVLIDDGSGVPPAALVAEVASAVDAVRALGATFSVRGPVTVRVNVTMRARAPTEARLVVQAAVLKHLAGLAVGVSVAPSRIVQVAHEADTRVELVSDVLVNGVAGELAMPVFGRAVAGDVIVNG